MLSSKLRSIFLSIFFTVIFAAGSFAGTTDIPKEIEPGVKEIAEKFNCRIVLQVEDPDGKTYDIGYDGREHKPITDLSSEYIDIGSCTKMFTASSIFQLIESGKLKLDDKLFDIFPDENILRDMLVIDGVDYIENVTVKNLLNHTSGLQDYFRANDSIEIALHGDSSLRFIPWDIVALAKGLNKAEFIPGTEFKYSNTNYILLGLIIEKYSGMTYAEYIKKNILEPLGMKHTFLPSAFSLPGRKDGHFNNKKTTMPATLAWSAGEIVSTPDDMNKFIRGWYSGKLFSEEMCQEIRRKYYDKTAPPIEFGLGVLRGPEKCFGHAGQTFGFQAYIGHTTNGYSFAFGMDDAAVNAFLLESIVANFLIAEK